MPAGGFSAADASHVSTGSTAIAAVRLLQAAMLRVRAVDGCPLFQRGAGSSIPLAETQPSLIGGAIASIGPVASARHVS
ncbi:hypothetical protein CO669_18165 [Bradyrhizobium sp. Y36]|nr:hypothetical protein CO669_18165 [Bradyrhizobium sp. Y36]